MAYSPYTSSTPGDEYYYGRERFQSATPTPSPRASHSYYAQQQATPQRPATRAHFRNASTGFNEYSPRPPTASPRYTSDGYYATANVSSGHHSRKPSWSTPTRPRDERRRSFVYVRSSTPHGDSDEDEIIEVDGRTYIIPAKSRQAGGRTYLEDSYLHASRGRSTDFHSYPQGGYTFQDRDAAYEQPQPRPRATPTTHARRSSATVPQRPATARPTSSHTAKKTAAPAPAKATEADAKRHRIPPGYSLKNWDPAEDPILLLGSVFDANSLGKWIYDWTVYRHGPSTPIAEVAGDLWLLLIQLSGKVKRAEECVERVRSKENREIMEDFIDSGERLQDKLRKLLKACEQPMLKAASTKKGGSQLGKNAGVEFVETLFGRERELDKTERFMQGVRLFNLRFDANCEDIIRNPTK
ncbi:hypothetical protein SODALDRAFT_326696 [Sodiomyces alkalinus F11]|uniref:Vegetative cell wall protein gp1 n=1 Tax=Sodiomyces alkalinus (strain CBS 110278 / VKM F-3762 / F11) TaxID=1314773 RepID=A0A3N2Q6W9_SODAK|nr:hypothetical protein SODALDRAFT_326696 [Sodiomyces alkalinus F11]ROT42533.1 hypothetical protein SODALDRAFT_326696 [Sodiomyces alkalinus F11]